MPKSLYGAVVILRPPAESDVAVLARIRGTPEVLRYWPGEDDLAAQVRDELADPEVETFVVEQGGHPIGAIQWSAETDPQYRHASIDIYLDPAKHGRGLGTDAVRTLVRYLLIEHGYHRLTINPAADNVAAIGCYRKIGFQPVGVMRQYERGPDGTWHDGLLMDLLAEEFNRNDCIVDRDSGIAGTLADRPVMADGGFQGSPR